MATGDIFIRKLKNDLKWVLSSPGIMSRTFQEAFLENPYCNDYPPDQLYQCNNLLALERRIRAKKIKRIGLYYEMLCHYLLCHMAGNEVLLLNRQVIIGGRTYGEIDQLYRIIGNEQLVHKELAVKFYLGLINDVNAETYWVGPNIKGRLDIKLNHLVQHQLRLTQDEVVKHWLADMDIESEIRVEAQLQGYLFYPFDIKCSAPNFSNPEHLQGIWITHSQIDLWSDTLDEKSYVVCLDKFDWFSGQNLYYTVDTLNRIHYRSRSENAKYCHDQVVLQTRPLMFEVYAMCRDSHTKNKRIFIVDDKWPEKALDFVQSIPNRTKSEL